MNIVLLSGGSGKRLWPLSNDIRSKQFIKVFRDADGEYESMVQRVYGQIKAVMPDAQVTIATAKSQVSSILNQLGDKVGLSVEPCRRDTFPAIVLSAAYLADIKKVSLEEPVIVCPVDPYVENDYFIALENLAVQVSKGEANLVLMGIEPTYPSEKYGYIIPVGKDPVCGVAAFKEKPSEAVAQEYIAQGALWNGGVFAFKLGYLLDKAHTLLDFVGYDDLLANYASLEKISFDYAVVEQEEAIQVMRFQGQWKDLGTWNTMTESMAEDITGKAQMDDSCENVHIINELDVPVLAMGLKDVVVVASPEGVLVSDKDQSDRIKPFVEKFQQQIMYAEKSWGSYQVLNVDDGSMTVLVTLNQGCGMSYHSHEHRSEMWTVIDGYGHAVLDGSYRNIKKGDILSMPVGCRHTVHADTMLKIVEVQLGNNITVGDKIKHDYIMDTKCFGNLDIRGIYPDQVNEDLAYRIGRYFPVVLKEKNENNTVDVGSMRIAVGRDIRLSGESLSKSVIDGLADAGCQVIDIGQCGTEMLYFAVFYLHLDGGIMVTASHNPKSYNGFKLVAEGAKPLSKNAGLGELEYLCRQEADKVSVKTGSVIARDILSDYVGHLLSYVDVAGLEQSVKSRQRPFRLVVNPGNGGAGPVLDILAEKLPFEFIKVNYEPDGNFPNGVPNPLLNENREVTEKAVRQYKADAGIAWDGDFDRCFMFDETGAMIEGYYMVGFLAEAFLRKDPGSKIIHDARVFWNTQDICRANKGEAVLSPSGHSLIKAKMREVDAIYGGEMSAHHYFRDFNYCDSGMIPWLLAVELLVQSGRKMSEIVSDRMEMYPISGEVNTHLDDMAAADRIISNVERQYADGTIDHVDGLSVAYDEWRFNLRKSNTEPVLRLNVETKMDRILLKEKTEELLRSIRG